MDRYPEAVEKAIDVHSELNPDQLVDCTEEQYSHYACKICTQVVYEPMMCKNFECGTLLDRTCYERYKNKLKKDEKPIECPNCRSDSGYSEKVPPVIKQALSVFEFSCSKPVCGSKYKVI